MSGNDAHPTAELLGRLQSDPPNGQQVSRWLDQHQADVLELVRQKGATMAAELLGIGPACFRDWRRAYPNVIIRADGQVVPHPPANGRCYTLEELVCAIGGGYIEIVQTKDTRLIVLDEEGKRKGFPVNAAATALYQHGAVDHIVGDVLVCETWRID